MKLTKIKINNFFDKKKILITGASGFVGQNLIKNLSKYNSNIVALYANEIAMRRKGKERKGKERKGKERKGKAKTHPPC